MKYLLAVPLFFLLASCSEAFNPAITETARPYEVVTLEDEVVLQQEYLGELEGFPIMYEITNDEPFTLQAHIQQLYRSGSEPINFSLIAIRQNERGGGVTEVTRLRSSSGDWQRIKSSWLGMPLWQSPSLSVPVEPGTYQVEISTPENEGKYLLSFGTQESDDGYFTTLAGIHRTQNFFGVSFFKLLLSSYVYYPLGILLLVFMLQRIWKYRKLISQHDS